jgi:hypothetical protein
MAIDPVLVPVQLLSVACVVHLWARPDPVWLKVLWTPLLPVAGPILYGAAHDPPSVQAEIDRALDISEDSVGHG